MIMISMFRHGHPEEVAVAKSVAFVTESNPDPSPFSVAIPPQAISMFGRLILEEVKILDRWFVVWIENAVGGAEGGAGILLETGAEKYRLFDAFPVRIMPELPTLELFFRRYEVHAP